MLVSSKLKGKPWVSSTQNPSTSHWVRRISWKRWNECSTIIPARWLWKRNSSDEYGRSEKRTFNEYYHDKIVMANRISIDTDEIIDYVVEGIPDVRLCDQARLSRFKDLIEARISCWGKSERNSVGAIHKKPKEKTKIAASTPRQVQRPEELSVSTARRGDIALQSTWNCEPPRANQWTLNSTNRRERWAK